jgi:hypothetical protein
MLGMVRNPLCAVLAVLVLSIITAVVPVAAAYAVTDADGDGLDDGLEDALAATFFPYVWFDSGENSGCTDPATATNPGTAVARVRPHPGDPAKIAVSYAILYRRDCGDWYGGAHHGDVEPFSMTLASNGACALGYGAFALKTTAHTGTWFEHSDQRWLGGSCTWGRLAGGSPSVAKIYSAENKHGNYAFLGTCEDGAGGNDHCSESFTRSYTVSNAGEDYARRFDELSAYQFPGEYAWSPVPFSGSLSRSSDAGLVRDKLLDDGLLAPAW